MDTSILTCSSFPESSARPVPDSPSNPFLDNDAPTNPNGDFLNRPRMPTSAGEESFPNPSPSSSIGSTLGTPANRPRGTPRVGRHSTAQNATVGGARAVKKQRVKKGARDIWTFFEDNNEAEVRTCVFCQYVFFVVIQDIN